MLYTMLRWLRLDCQEGSETRLYIAPYLFSSI
jgi:hypothetical protein